MTRWLALAAVAPLVVAEGQARAQNHLAIPHAVVAARSHVLDFRLAQEQGIERSLPLMRGMLVQQGIAPNAAVGLGLANLYARKKGADASLGERLSRSRKPAVTFVLKF